MLKTGPSLISRLTAADRSYQGAKSRSFLCRAVAWALAALLLFFIVDVVFQLNLRPRLALIGIFLMATAAVAGLAFYIWRVRRNPVQRVARLVETQDPRLGSKVINLLQLNEQTKDESLPDLTRQLAGQAVTEYERELGLVDFISIARLPRLRSDFHRALLALALFGLVLAAFWRVSKVEILRFADPMGDHPPFSFTQLAITEPTEKGVQVIYNKSSVVQVKYSGHEPKEVFLSFYDPVHPGKTNTIEMFNKGRLGFWQQIDNIKSDLVIFAHTRDFHSISAKRQIGVILTPKLERAFVKVSPPPYTGLKPEENAFQFKEVRALQGSQVQIRLQSNRPLRGGEIDWRASTGAEPRKIAMTASGENEVSALIPAQESGRMRFAMTDVRGIVSEDLLEGSLTVTHDLPPEIVVAEPDKDCFVSMDFKILGRIEASDDYGLAEVRLHRALNGVYSAPTVIAYHGIVRSARETVPFNFKELGVEAGDVISFFAEAIDTAPAPNLSRSQTVNMTVISEDDYNSFVREQKDIADIQDKYSELLNQFQDRIDEQKKIGEQIENLQQQLAKAPKGEKGDVERRINELIAKQSEINSKLGKTADAMDAFVRKKPAYDIESEYQNILSEKAQAIRDSTAANDKAMQSAGQKPPGLESVADLKKASDEQLRKLGALEQEAREQIADAGEDLGEIQELLKDFNHFEQLFETQQSLAEQNRAYNSSAALPREDQIALRQLASVEKDVEEELRELSKKLREDAKVAEKKFPKAAQSGRDLADNIEKRRLPPLAADATDAMLAAQGEKSATLSERLRAEMERMFSECQSQGQQQAQNEEMDTYLKLHRNMNAGNTFQQMRQSRKFGGHGDAGKTGEGKSRGSEGQGTGGYVISSQPATDVLGGETSLAWGDAKAPSTSKMGKGQGAAAQQETSVQLEKGGAETGLTPVNRKSDAVTSEAPVDSYDEIVNKYFKAITK